MWPVFLLATNKINARTVLWLVTFCGFFVNYMIRININIAIVSMVAPKKTNQTAHGYCHIQKQSEAKTLHVLPMKHHFCSEDSHFDWNERQMNQVLGSFFWFHWLLQIPGGVLARRFGTKVVFGLGNVAMSVLSFIMPAAASLDYRALMFVRVIQGLIGGICWPSMHHMTAHWIPPNERSKFVSAYLGSSVGVAVTYPLCGLILDSIGWESVFYVTGGIGVAWFIAWWFLVYDTPDLHPRCSQEERDYINHSLGKASSNNYQLAVPWRSILLSRPLWMNIIAQWGGIWGLFTLMTQAPTYLNFIHGRDIKMTGVWSGLPHLFRWLFAFAYAVFSDWLLKTGKVSKTNVRKLATAVCTVLQGCFVLGLALCGCNTTAAIILLVTATGIHGAVSSGPLASLVDLSPNFASILQGISGMIGVVPGFVSPIVVGYLTYQNQTVEQWGKVYLITAAMLLVCGLLYVMFASSELQPWNSGLNTAPDHFKLQNGKSRHIPAGNTVTPYCIT